MALGDDASRDRMKVMRIKEKKKQKERLNGEASLKRKTEMKKNRRENR